MSFESTSSFKRKRSTGSCFSVRATTRHHLIAYQQSKRTVDVQQLEKVLTFCNQFMIIFIKIEIYMMKFRD